MFQGCGKDCAAANRSSNLELGWQEALLTTPGRVTPAPSTTQDLVCSCISTHISKYIASISEGLAKHEEANKPQTRG